MFTEPILREYPEIIKAFMGIPSEVFWQIVEVVTVKIPEFDQPHVSETVALGGNVISRSCCELREC